ncbi:MAG: hypothetical protein ACT4OF_01725 [Caulobacteraceae bacterium]
MALQVEHMDDALPDRLALELLAHRHGLDECRPAAVLAFDRFAELVLADFHHPRRMRGFDRKFKQRL